MSGEGVVHPLINSHNPFTTPPYKTFNTQPREAIHTAFRHSRHYVVCDCCNDEQLSHSQHDTSIAYRIYLECGKMINLYDWYVAFGTILERDGKQHSESQVQ